MRKGEKKKGGGADGEGGSSDFISVNPNNLVETRGEKTGLVPWKTAR